MIDFFFYIHLTDFLLLELCRQFNIPLTGDLKYVYKLLGRSPFKVHY